MLAALVALLAGCGRVGFDPLGDGGRDALVDYLDDGGRATDAARSEDGSFMPDANEGDAGPDALRDAAGDGPMIAEMRDSGSIVGYGNECTTTADCPGDLGCNPFGYGTGTCAEFCTSSTDCARTGVCAIYSTEEDWATCLTACNPRENTGCPSGLGCRILSVQNEVGAMVFGASCGAPGGAALGACCASLLDCAPGTVCTGMPSGICRSVCTDDSQCPGFPPGSCVFLDVAVDGTSYGYCLEGGAPRRCDVGSG